MKKITAVILLLAMCIGLAACESNAENQTSISSTGGVSSSESALIESSQSSQIEDTEDLSVYIRNIEEHDEDGTIFCYVIISDDFGWNEANLADQKDLAMYAINECIDAANARNYQSAEIMGETEDNNTAFIWDKDNSVDIYINGEYEGTHPF